MDFLRHIAFRTSDHAVFLKYLRDNNIPVDLGEIISAIDIYESHPKWQEVLSYVEKFDLFSTTTTTFTKQELLSAPWLNMWCSWRCGYPQPESCFVTENDTYLMSQKCPQCGSGATQIAPFRMKGTPKWGRRYFAELDWIGDEIFLNQTARSFLEKEKISGITFQEVLKKNENTRLDNVFQMNVENVLSPGIVEEKTSFKKINICTFCGQKKYLLNGRGMLGYREEVFQNAPDVIKTAEIFGSMHYAVRMIIVSNKFYQTVIVNQLDRNLVFSPIALF